MKQLYTILVAIVIAGFSSALAQPANDNFANRFLLNGLLVITNGTTVGATVEAGEPSINNEGDQTVWYEWTPPVQVLTTFRAGGNGYRTLLGIYEGDAVNALGAWATPAAAAGQTNATVTFTPIAGLPYKIKVDRRNTAIAGTFSLVISQQVSGPLVSFTSPFNGETVTNPVNIALGATVSTPLGGTVTNVSFFYQGNVLIGSDTTGPYSFVWTNPAPATYTVTAVATDDSGRVGTSAITVFVVPPGYFSYFPVFIQEVWKYRDDGSDQGTAWRLPAFDDTAWASGPAELGYGDGDEATVVSFGPDPNNKFVTTYFRCAFMITDAE
ncbi:MAG TPA: Ig-like domain-containing protein, partial [Candidatus Limnocylindria bacterium]|nr:Ig-like domain-containing protein [Candidatus Limnocylindria bacterium]